MEKDKDSFLKDSETKVQIAKMIVIDNKRDYEEAVQFLKGIKLLYKQIKQSFEPMRQRAQETVKAILRERDQYLRPIEKAEAITKQKIDGFLSEIEEAERKAKQQAEATGLTIQSPPPGTKKELTKDVGITRKEDWDFEVMDKEEIPREYLIPDLKKIRMAVKALKGECRIPGIRAYKKHTIQSYSFRGETSSQWPA